MKAYICDVCETTVVDPHVARMREFCFTISNSDIYQVPMPDKVKTKIHLCNNCFESLKDIAKGKAQRQKCGECKTQKEIHGGNKMKEQIEKAILEKAASKFAGHSDYHGDTILQVLYCMAEGKDVGNAKPIERQNGMKG